MSLKDKLTDDLKQGIRDGDETRKSTLRALSTAIRTAEEPKVAHHRIGPGDTWESVAAKYGVDPKALAAAYDASLSDAMPPKAPDTGKPLKEISIGIPQEQLGEAGVQAVIAKQIKQHRDSIEAFEKAGRQDLVDKEAAELKVLEGYLPAQMSRDEIEKEARAVIAETGASGPGDKGRVMGALMPRLAGRAEGREINEAVTKLLAGG